MKQLRGQFDLQLCDGTEVGVILNMYALGNFLAETDHELENLEDLLQGKNALRFVPLLMWHGVQCFYQMKDAEPPLTKGQFTVLYGSSDWNEMNQLMMTALQLDEPKKKATTTKKKKKQ